MLGALDSQLVRHVVQDAMEFHVLIRSQLPLQARVLKDDPEAAPHFVLLPLRVEPIDFDDSARRLQQRRQHLDGCGLAGAIWAQKGKDFTLVNFKGDVIDGDEVTKGFDQAAHSDHRGGASKSRLGGLF